jgi:hypothetical protein
MLGNIKNNWQGDLLTYELQVRSWTNIFHICPFCISGSMIVVCVLIGSSTARQPSCWVGHTVQVLMKRFDSIQWLRKSRITVVLAWVQYFLGAQMIWSHDISFLVRGLTPSIFMGALPAYLHETPHRAKHCSVNIYKQHLSSWMRLWTVNFKVQLWMIKRFFTSFFQIALSASPWFPC